MIAWLEGVNWAAIIVIAVCWLVFAVLCGPLFGRMLRDTPMPPAPGVRPPDTVPPQPPAPAPGHRLIVSIETLRSGDRLTRYACACYELHARSGPLIYGRACRSHADWATWEKELQP